MGWFPLPISTSSEGDCDSIAGFPGTQSVWVWRDADPTEVQAVSVPACLDCDVCIEVTGTVVTTRPGEQVEFIFRK